MTSDLQLFQQADQISKKRKDLYRNCTSTAQNVSPAFPVGKFVLCIRNKNSALCGVCMTSAGDEGRTDKRISRHSFDGIIYKPIYNEP